MPTNHIMDEKRANETIEVLTDDEAKKGSAAAIGVPAGDWDKSFEQYVEDDKTTMQKPATTFATIRTPSSYPASQKRCIHGSRADLCVPYRELSLSPTHHSNRLEENPPVPIYDTSGPYTDPKAEIDLARGLPALRSTWIQEREDTERLGAGIGLPSHACQVMEWGYDGVLLNTAVSRAIHPVEMAGAFAGAVRAGRSAFLAGPMTVQQLAVRSTPELGRPFSADSPESNQFLWVPRQQPA